jgi:hypothetical protein
MENRKSAKAPFHLWIVGILSLIWNAGSAYDYLMTNIRDPNYLEQMGVGAEMMQLIDAFPIWTMAAWGIGVWGAVAGSLLLLLRSRYCAYAFALSLLGLAASTFYQLGIDLPKEMTTVGMIAMTLAIWVVAVCLLLYSIRTHKKGMLR